MSSSKLGSIHDLLQCPYNPSHMVGASKFQTHLINCRKNNPDIAKTMTICPYNQTHHVLEEDLSLHLLVCREYLDQQLQGLTSTGALPDEIWDDEEEEVGIPSNSTSFSFGGPPSEADGSEADAAASTFGGRDSEACPSEVSEGPPSLHQGSVYSRMTSECGRSDVLMPDDYDDDDLTG